jgi:molecular chaperone GrpE
MAKKNTKVEKNKNTEEIKVQVTKEKENVNENEIKKEEINIEELQKENKILQEQNSKVVLESVQDKLKIQELESKIKKIEEEYVIQVKKKAEEAQKIVDNKINELNLKAEEEIKNIKKYALEKDGSKILEGIYNLEVAINAISSAPKEVQNYLMGIKMVYSSFQEILKDLNINTIPVNEGDIFDENCMEVFDTESNNNLENNKVIKVISKGYKLHDKIIKYCSVIVNKNNS